MALNRWGYGGKLYLLLKSTIKLTSNFGFCPTCKRKTFFVKDQGDYDRDFLECLRCGSLPRQRMFMLALDLYCPDWKNKTMHESSPGSATSIYMEAQCKSYSSSQYFPNIKTGTFKDDIRCENLEELTFSDNTFDIFVSQEVMEHVFNPDKAFFEIARVLKPGGIHVFTTPLVPNILTKKRATIDLNGKITHFFEPSYHGNPVDPNGSLLTYDYGTDFPILIQKWSGMATTTYKYVSKKLGLVGELCEAFISFKEK
jgi:SAM-dependent methyltransferase